MGNKAAGPDANMMFFVKTNEQFKFDEAEHTRLVSVLLDSKAGERKVKRQVESFVGELVNFELFCYAKFKSLILFYIDFLRKLGARRSNFLSEEQAQLLPNGLQEQARHPLHEDGQELVPKPVFGRFQIRQR